MRLCSCGSGLSSYELLDCHGIYCARVCDDCESVVRGRFNPWIFSGYSQADVDEPIEPE